MSELDALGADIQAAILASRNKEQCKLCVEFQKMSGARRELWQNALRSSIGHTKLVGLLRKHGLDIGRPTVITHRQEGHA